ncbi:MAG: FAD:protein FMN transferase [Patescibacteria group bacterium]|nr:FAD:protein FMN transferase [Patescibacteria group bacterium]
MQQSTRVLMGMPITVKIIDPQANTDHLDEVFAYLDFVDHKFSTYKETSEISQINQHRLTPKQYSQEMIEVLNLCAETKQLTNGYFDIENRLGLLDPSGLVKGWAIQKSAEILWKKGLQNFYIEAGGDVQVSGQNERGQNWRIGIQNPFQLSEIVQVICLTNCGLATSGSYLRGPHIYNPQQKDQIIEDVVSLTVIGPNVYEADRFATAAFAMGKKGIEFISSREGLAGYMIDNNKVITQTANFAQFTD